MIKKLYSLTIFKTKLKYILQCQTNQNIKEGIVWGIKRVYHIMNKGSIYQKDVTILVIYVPNKTSSKYIK